MKKTTLLVMFTSFFALTIFTLVSCNGDAKDDNKSASDQTEGSKGQDIDYRLLEKKEPVSKWQKEIAEKLGDHKGKTEEISFSISRPATEGMVKRKGEPDNLMISISYQDPNDKNKVMHQVYNSRSGWGEAKSTELQVMGPGKEEFSLSNELFDFAAINPDIINKVIADALVAKKDPKYKEQYINNCRITKEGFTITIQGKLALNDQMKSETYYADLQGSAKP